jgi:hypothetical protein
LLFEVFPSGVWRYAEGEVVAGAVEQLLVAGGGVLPVDGASVAGAKDGLEGSGGLSSK